MGFTACPQHPVRTFSAGVVPAPTCAVSLEGQPTEADTNALPFPIFPVA